MATQLHRTAVRSDGTQVECRTYPPFALARYAFRSSTPLVKLHFGRRCDCSRQRPGSECTAQQSNVLIAENFHSLLRKAVRSSTRRIPCVAPTPLKATKPRP